ncbi:MAG: RNA polymerase sigma factor [Patescibacteria group bacterium]
MRASQIPKDLAEQSDEKLLAASRETPAVFSVLVSRYQEAFLRKGRSILARQEDAEDAVQESFVKIYINAHTFTPREGASFKSWAYRILLNECFARYRRMKTEREFASGVDQEMLAFLPDERMVRERTQALDADYVLSLLSRIPEVFRQVLTLHFLKDKSQRDIARELGISEGAVRTRVHRAKEALQKERERLECIT